MEDEQLKNTLNASNYRAQSNQQLPYHQNPVTPQHFHFQHHAQHLPKPTAETQQHIPSHTVSQPSQQRQSSFSPSDFTFLVTSLKEVLKEDLGREIAKIKENLNAQVQSALKPQNIQQIPQIIQPLPNRQIIQQQLQTPPNLYNLQMVPHHQ